MSRDDYAQQGKQFVNDLRDSVTKKVADNEQSILGTVGKAARWVDQKTGGKYADQIGKAEAKVGEGVGWAAKQGTGEPQGPGSAAGDGTEPGTRAPGTPSAPGAAATGPAGPSEPSTGPVGPPSDTPTDPGRPTHPPRDDASDWPRPPRS